MNLLKSAPTLMHGSDPARAMSEWVHIFQLYRSGTAQRVFSSWLENGGDPLVISGAFKEYLDRWVGPELEPSQTTGWHLLFKNWIRFSEEKDYVIPYVEAWLVTVDFYGFFDGQDFLAEWLRQQALPIDTIRDAVWTWLKNPDHLLKKNSRMMINAIAQYRPELVDNVHQAAYQDVADACLKNLENDEDRFYVICDVLTLKLPFHYEDELIAWLNDYGATNDYRVSILLRLWLQVTPHNPNLRWYLISYCSKRIFASKARDNEL
ncbi:hypothetical protein ACCT25_37425, partial [Rhizobium ruizarguesonis]